MCMLVIKHKEISKLEFWKLYSLETALWPTLLPTLWTWFYAKIVSDKVKAFPLDVSIMLTLRSCFSNMTKGAEATDDEGFDSTGSC